MAAGLSLVSGFEEHARRSPGVPAVTGGGRTFSYQELQQWSDAVCADVLAAGASPGSLVGVSVRAGAAQVAAILGVLKAGCGYVPLDPAYPAARLSFIMSDSAMAVALVEPDVDCGAPEAVRLVPMAGPGARRSPASRPEVDGASPAYVIYTSGSTGEPKGVLIRHANVLALFRAASGHFAFGPDESWSFFHSYSFDFSVWEIWGALLHGGRIVCVPAPLRMDPAGFVEFLVRTGVTVLNMVPSVFRHLVAGGAGPQDELRLRHLVFGGEAVDPDAVAHWLRRLPEHRRPVTANMYGITETTVHATYRRMTDEDFRMEGPGTLIGTALPHLRMWLADEGLRPVAPGQVGEILLSGPGVSDGYLYRDALNRERFPSLPGTHGAPRRTFRSGDLALWSERHGSFVYRGRLDDQVQLRGFRIELGEVEAALRRCPLVSDAAVVLDRTPASGPALIGHVVPLRRDADTVPMIRKHLVATLPRHLVPERIRLVDGLPRTASGKTDRNKLLTGES
jgi:amino acid adenylation domain-containing protein